MAYEKKAHEGKVGQTPVYHLTPTYHGHGFVTIVTPICFCSGIYVNTDENGKKNMSMSIWLYRKWNKDGKVKTEAEQNHEQFWRDLHKTTSLLDTEEYEEMRQQIGIPMEITDEISQETKPNPMIKVIKPFVRIPKYQNGPNKGKVNPDLPPRVKPNVWLAKPKDTQDGFPAPATKGGKEVPKLKAVPEKKDDNKDGLWNGQRLLCKFENLDKTPRPLEELYQQPFLGKFTIVWASDFIGSHNTHQLKVSHVAVCELLPKMQFAGMTEEERMEAMNEYAELHQEDEEAGSGPVLKGSAERGNEEEDEEKEKKKSTPKKKEKKEEQEEDEEEKPKKDKKKEKKTKVKVQDLANDEPED